MALKIRGIAVPFGVPMRQARNGWRPMFTAGAFASAVGRFDVPVYVNHRRARDITTSLEVQDSRDGLFFAGIVEDPDWADVLWTAAQNRRFHGVSISWTIPVVSTKCHTTGIDTISSARLTEISMVIGDEEPAFPNTWVQLEYIE